MQERSGGRSVLGRSLTIGLDLVRGRRRYRYAGLGGRGDHQIRSGPSWRGALVGALVVVAVALGGPGSASAARLYIAVGGSGTGGGGGPPGHRLFGLYCADLG